MQHHPAEPLIIVAVKRSGSWLWHRSIRDYWVLDLVKWKNSFLDSGYRVDLDDYSYRFDIPIADETTADVFLEKMRPYLLNRETLARELEAEIRNGVTWWDVAHLFPVLMVDFDDRRVASLAETPLFDLYVPDGWIGSCDDFFAELPLEERYWVRGGQDLMDLFR